jgi:hypothetical protein
MSPERTGEIKRFLIAAVVVGFFTVPVFRSGGRTGLTCWGWLINHTIFGPPVEYVPEEDYAVELKGVKLVREITPSQSLDGVISAYGA